MSPKVSFNRLADLFEPESPVPTGLLKEAVAVDFKSKAMIGVPDAQLRISFSPDSGDDILIRRIDPENALGYSVYASEEEYFDHLQSELYEPTEEDVLGGLGEQ